MPEYNYDIVLQTPIGDRQGKLTLRIEPPILKGICTLLGYSMPCTGKIDKSGHCTLRGQFKTFMSVIEYSGCGYADSKRVDFKLNDNDNHYRMIGTACL